MAATQAHDLLAAIDTLLVDDYARFRTGLAGPDDPRAAISIDDLLPPGETARIVARFNDRIGPTDPRAIFSIWAASHFTSVMPTILAANILLDRTPTLALEQVGFIIAADRRAPAIHIGPDIMRLDGAAMFDRFRPLVQSYLAPLIRILATRGGVTERVLWSNAGNVFEAFTAKLAGLAAGRGGLAQARDLLETPNWADGSRNPLFRPVSYIDGRRKRRICCLRLLVPNNKLCQVCPVIRRAA